MDFDFRVVKEDLDLSGVQPAGGFDLLAGPIDKGGIDPMQGLDALRALGASPFGQSGLVGSLLQAHQFHEHLILTEALGIGKGSAATGEGEKDLSHIGRGAEARTGPFARV